MSMETIFYEKKWMRHLQRKNLFGLFISYYPIGKDSSNKFWRLIKYSINYCGSYIIISFGTNRLLETKIFEKKSIVPVTKTFWPSFSRIIAHQKSHATFYTCSQGILIVFVWIKRSFRWDVRYRWKQLFLRKKNATFQRKNSSANFLSLYRVYETSSNKLWGSKRYCESYCTCYKIISLGTKRLLETKIFEKSYRSSDQNILALFFSYYRASKK